MMTRNDVRTFANGRPVVTISYCDAQSLCSRLTKVGYNAGVYGWNYDVFDADEYVIVTGYRPIGKFSQDVHEVCRKFESAVRSMGFGSDKSQIIESYKQAILKAINK